jgi:hypothetical protein
LKEKKKEKFIFVNSSKYLKPFPPHNEKKNRKKKREKKKGEKIVPTKMVGRV